MPWGSAAVRLDAPTDFIRVVDSISIDSLQTATGEKSLDCRGKLEELAAHRVHLDMQRSFCLWEQE